MKTMDELRMEKPQLSIADSINLHRELYGPRMEWDDRKVYVRFREKEYDITGDAENIAVKHIGDEGFNMVSAFNESFVTRVKKIAGEKASRRFQNLTALEIIALG